MRSLYLVILIIITFPALAQITFQRNYGTVYEETAYAAQQTSDGGFIIAGDMSGSQSRDIYLVKTDEWGDTIWTRIYLRNWSEYAKAVLELSDGFIVAGSAVTSLGPSRTDVYLLRTNNQGDSLWTKTIGGLYNEQAFDIKVTTDGGFIIGGQADDNTGQVYYYLVKTDPMGVVSWSEKYGISIEERAYGKAVQQTSDGGFIITGYVDDYTIGTGTGYIYVVKTDLMGVEQWTESYDWSESEVAYAVEETSDGYILVGRTYSMGAGSTDALMMKIDFLGNLVWTKTYGDTLGELAYAVEKTADGGFILSGVTYSSGAGSGDYYLIKTDTNGDTIWTRTFGGSHREEAYDVKQTADGGYLLAGYSYSFSVGGSDFFCVKTDGNGWVPIKSLKEPSIIREYKLYQNFPNPFNPTTKISWQLPVSSPVDLSVYSITGERIATLVKETYPAGFHTVEWNAVNLASGVYWYRFKAGDYVETKKMILLR